ncbi:hypothetical protein [Pseudomonas oryzihabitans]|uniref:hypothetical protein n=1 Tax=Pseudomonas oryzihabitans TaxID=47885 RepID=UPI00111D25B5|nr:hypothetical protein [Pseudomonas psychrotolerans]QDD90647.1 hypothetical protein CCZ28_17145 [Pseudomonas psychrotolerans]
MISFIPDICGLGELGKAHGYSTGSLTTSDIKNEARYDGSSVTLSGGYQTGDQGSTVGRGADGNAQAGALGKPLIPDLWGKNVGSTMRWHQ